MGVLGGPSEGPGPSEGQKQFCQLYFRYFTFYSVIIIRSLALGKKILLGKWDLGRAPRHPIMYNNDIAGANSLGWTKQN